MFKLVICCLNSKYIHSSLAPWCLLAGAKRDCEKGITAQVVEGTINEKIDEIVGRIIEKNPDAVSFCCYIWNINEVKETAKKIKQALPSVTIIFGGPEAGFNQKNLLLENDFVDYILCGEGEEALPELVNHLFKNESIPDSLAGKRCGNAVVLGAYQTMKTEISPYCEEYFRSLSGRIAYIESSRGCPFSCAFCLSGAEKKVRFFDIDRIKSEMLALSAAGAKTIKFVDRTFNCNKSRAKKILEFIKANYTVAIADGVCFHFEISADLLDDELLDIIESEPVGSVQFEAGIQSFNSKTLEKIGRKTDMQRLSRNIERLVSFRNCHVHIDLIAGLSFETYESFKNSFDCAFALGADMLQLGFLKILYGSRMETRRDDFPCEYSETPPYEVVSTPWMSEEELLFLHDFEDVFERLYNSGRFHRTVKYIICVSKKRPFDVFSSFAKSFSKAEASKMPLDMYTQKVFEFFETFDGVDKTALRDNMIMDRLATNSSGIIPKCLQVKDENLKKAKHELSLMFPAKRGVMRSVAILYSREVVVWCDYENKNAVSLEYQLNEIGKSELFDL